VDKLLQNLRLLDVFGYLAPGIVFIFLSLPLLDESIRNGLAKLAENQAIGIILALPFAYGVGLLISYTAENLYHIAWKRFWKWKKSEDRPWLHKPTWRVFESLVQKKCEIDLSGFSPEETHRLAEAVVKGTSWESEVDRLYAMNKCTAGMSAVCGLLGIAYFMDGYLSVGYGQRMIVAIPMAFAWFAGFWACRDDEEHEWNQTISCSVIAMSCKPDSKSCEK
jgi:hypothetical protein